LQPIRALAGNRRVAIAFGQPGHEADDGALRLPQPAQPLHGAQLTRLRGHPERLAHHDAGLLNLMHASCTTRSRKSDAKCSAPFCPLLARERSAGRAVALAVMVRTVGSTHQPPGALLLIFAVWGVRRAALRRLSRG
jgi:hypothetical protein